MKKILISTICVAVMLSASMPAFAAERGNAKAPSSLSSASKSKYNKVDCTLKINDKEVDLGKIHFYKINNKIVVPLQFISEKLEVKVKLNKDKKKVHIEGSKMQMDLTIGDDLYCSYSKKAIGMTEPEKLGVAPLYIKGKIYVPVDMYKVLFTDAACVSEDNNVINIKTVSSSDQTTQIPNPLVEYATLEEAEKALNFKAAVPAVPIGYEMKNIVVINNDLLEIFYYKGDSCILYRTSNENGDISGDYSNYAKIEVINIGDVKVTVKGSGDGIKLAVWSVEDKSFSIAFDQSTDEKNLTSIIESIK